MTTIPSLVIGIATTATERRQLAQLLGGTETFLIVSSAHQARRFLDLVRRPSVTRAPAVPTDTASPAVPIGDVGPGVGDLPAGGDAAPSGAEVIPTRAGMVPSRGGVVPTGAGVVPSRAGEIPSGVGAVPSRAGAVSSGVDAVPSGVEAVLSTVDAGGAVEGEAPQRRPTTELAVDSDRRVLRWREREVGLTPLEHDLLICLAGTPGRVWTYARLHRAVWGNDHLGRGSDMHSVVRRIRHKLGRLDAAATIHAVRGVGFRLTPS
ncbi:winged helix-turn-helix domain-containing protein [Micromonospora sp. NPDC051300]|uniref:winged helix-turn-helix domain-containing protein n=1 Tax=Micromonospora sp. NPDC051300 TaxID=3364286 RepID=UPI00378F5F87